MLSLHKEVMDALDELQLIYPGEKIHLLKHKASAYIPKDDTRAMKKIVSERKNNNDN